MDDRELRAIVRDAVARHMGRPLSGAAVRSVADVPVVPVVPAVPGLHSSHWRYLSLVNTSDACVIEPSVNCDHCGYCKSHGH